MSGVRYGVPAGIWDPSALVRRCLSEHRACAFQLMTGNGGLPHSKTKHQEMRHRSDERQKCLRKMLNRERLGGGLDVLGGDCPLYWKFLPGFGGWGRKPVVAWVWILFCLHLLCPSPHLWCQCLLPLALPEDPLSPATFSLPAKLSVK